MVLRARVENILERIPRRISRYGYDLLRAFDLRRSRWWDEPGRKILLCTHDLSLSGAPRIVLVMATALQARGFSPLVVALADGPMRAEFEALRITVLVDVRPRVRAAYLERIGQVAECAIVNSIASAPLALALPSRLKAAWYLHEVSLLEDKLNRGPIREALATAWQVWAGSENSGRIARRARAEVTVLPYGIEAVPATPLVPERSALAIGVFGSIEPRKGQDLAVAGYVGLSPELRNRIRLVFYGRVLDVTFDRDVRKRASAYPGICFAGELDNKTYRRAIAEADAVLVPSRDDTLPLVSIDALSAGRLLLLTRAVGTANWLEDGGDALIENQPDEDAMRRLFERALQLGPAISEIAKSGHARYCAEFSPDAFYDALYRRIHEA